MKKKIIHIGICFLLSIFLFSSQHLFAQNSGNTVYRIADLKSLAANNSTIYNLNGDMTFVYRSGSDLYIQDETGGLRIYDNTGIYAVIKNTFQEGDHITNIQGKLQNINGIPTLIPTKEISVATNNTGKVQPIDLTVTQFKTNYKLYADRLIRIKDAAFYSNFTFNTSGGAVYVWQGSTSNNFIFSNAYFRELNYIGYQNQTVTVTGIARANTYLLPRNINDIDTGIRIACIGNSITAGFGIGEAYAYPAVLKKMMGQGYDVRNYGVSGRTMLKKGDAPYWREAAFTNAKNFNPNVVIIKLGTNDSKYYNWKYKSEFKADMQALINEFANLASKPKIYIGLPAYVVTDNYYISNKVIFEEIIPIVKEVAKELNLETINFYELLRDRKDLIYDGVHPNVAGAKVMGEYVYNRLMSKPVIAATNKLDFPLGEVDEVNSGSINIFANNLTADMNVTITGNGFSTVTTIPKELAEQEQGYMLKVDFAPKAIGNYTGSIIISGGGIRPYTINLTGKGVKQKAYTIAGLKAFAANNSTIYTLGGDMTFVYRSGRDLYIQDETGGLRIYDNTGTSAVIKNTFQEGDHITDIQGKLLNIDGVPTLIPTKDIVTAIKNTGKVQPIDLTITQFRANYRLYADRLIRIKEGIFYSNFTFNSGGGAVYVWQGTISNNVVFSNAFFRELNYVGLQNKIASVTGIARVNTYLLPRNINDIDTGGLTRAVVHLEEIVDTNNQFSVIAQDGGVNIISDKDVDIVIYNLQGKLIKKTSVNAGSNFVNLEKGVYIINQTKVLVK